MNLMNRIRSQIEEYYGTKEVARGQPQSKLTSIVITADGIEIEVEEG